MPKPTLLEIPRQVARSLERKAKEENMNPAELALIYIWRGLLNHEQLIKSEKEIRDETLSKYPQPIPNK